MRSHYHLGQVSSDGARIRPHLHASDAVDHASRSTRLRRSFTDSVTTCRCQERHCALRIRRTSKESEARLRGSLCVGTGAEVGVSSRHPPLAVRHCDSGSAVASTLRLLAIAATALPSLPSCCLQWHAAESPRLGSTGRRLVLSSPSRRRRGPARRSSGQSVSLSEPTRDPHCMRARKAEPCHRPAPPFCMSFYVRAFC